jgi:hypothetical protein
MIQRPHPPFLVHSPTLTHSAPPTPHANEADKAEAKKKIGDLLMQGHVYLDLDICTPKEEHGTLFEAPIAFPH